MTLAFQTYWPLVFLGVIPCLWWAIRRTNIDLSSKHLRLATCVRTLVIVLLALAMMQPVLYLARKDISVVYLLDVSQSIAASELEGAIEWIQRTNDANRPGDAKFIAFASGAATVEKPNELATVKVGGPDQVIDRKGTNIAEAFDRAAHSFQPGHLKRVVLLSDGNDNEGDLRASLSRLEAEHVKVYTHALKPPSSNDVWVEAIKAPAIVTADEQFPLEVLIFSQADTDAEVELKDGDRVLAKRSARLKDGPNRIAFETSLKRQGETSMLSAEVKTAGDRFAGNNTVRQPVVVEGKPRILYVEGHAASSKYLHTALTNEGLDVHVTSPDSLPADVALLDAYNEVILSDVDPKLLSKAQMRAIASYVRDLGGGFILAGGENTYGEEGYSNTDVEDALPVRFNVRKKPPSVAMVVVLDASGSMNGAKIEVAKGASKAPLELMRPTDTFGAIVFNNTFTWAVPLQSAGNKQQIADQIGRISASGGTDAYPALNGAFTALAKVPDEIKLAILLTDGLTPPQPFQTLTSQMTKAGITVSTVSIGTGANRELMTDIAMWGRGRAYFIDRINDIPQIFVHETELALAQTLRETSFKAAVRKPVEAFKGIDFAAAPALLGYVATQAKPGAEVLLGDPLATEPLLARWQYGLGKSAAFMSDVKDRWAVEWLTWSGYPKFWAQLVRETMRRPDSNAFDFNVAREGGHAYVSINAIAPDGRFSNRMETQVSMIDSATGVERLHVPQTGPGRYETRVPVVPGGSYTFRAIENGADSGARVLAYSYPDEFRFYPVNAPRLQAISASTGGTFEPNGPEVFDPQGETATLPIAMWPPLGAFALTLFVMDILLRRLRLFER